MDNRIAFAPSYRLFGLLGLAVFLGGCAVLPPAQLEREVNRLSRPQVPVEVSWRRSAADDAAVARKVDELRQGGIGVNEAVAIALIANPDLQQRFESLGIARSAYLGAATAPNPILAGSARALRGGPGHNVEVSLVEDLLGLLLLPARAHAARTELEGANLEAANAVVGLVAATRIAAWRCLGAQRSLELRRQRAEIAGLLFELAQRFREAGNLTVIEQERERDAWLAARTALGTEELELARARETLVRLMGTTGLPGDWTLKGELPSLPPVDPSLEAITATALERRLDVQAAKRAAEARLARLSVTRGTRLTPHLQAGVSTESNPDGTRVTGPQAALELPLFSAGQAAIAAADSQARLAMREAESLALDARRDVRLAWAEMLEARRRHLALAGEAVPARERIVEGAQGEFAFMLKGAFDPLRSQEQLIEARESATAALADYWVARVALARAAGDLESLGGSRP